MNISVSVLDHRPKARLSEREIEAYISIASQGDLIHSRTLSAERAGNCSDTSDPIYMSKWIEATTI